MKTTRTFLFVLAGVLAMIAVASAILSLSLPTAAVFFYGIGTIFIIGFIALVLADEGNAVGPKETKPASPDPAHRPRRRFHLPFAHAS
jgi:predicted membrane channel-forming protein YqfA (hemolysin III family)